MGEHYEKVRQELLKFLLMCDRLKLKPSEVFKNNALTTQPFQRPGSYIFFKSLRGRELTIINGMLQAQKYFIYDFDHAFQTPLMIAINKKFTDLALKFIEMGADLEAEDVSGKTPLWYSIVNKTDDVTIALLENGANPYGRSNYNYDMLAEDP